MEWRARTAGYEFDRLPAGNVIGTSADVFLDSIDDHVLDECVYFDYRTDNQTPEDRWGPGETRTIK